MPRVGGALGFGNVLFGVGGTKGSDAGSTILGGTSGSDVGSGGVCDDCDGIDTSGLGVVLASGGVCHGCPVMWHIGGVCGIK